MNLCFTQSRKDCKGEAFFRILFITVSIISLLGELINRKERREIAKTRKV
jgi:hypothetical protein